MRGGFDVGAGLAGALDDAGNVIDPVLRKVVAVVPGRAGSELGHRMAKPELRIKHRTLLSAHAWNADYIVLQQVVRFP